jgi:hydrogenase maturation protease
VSGSSILVAGVGNIFLGDDAFGVEVIAQLHRRTLPENVKVVDFGIRGLDLTYALLENYEALILVDAMPRGGKPGTLYILEPEQEGCVSEICVEGHNLDPVKVLRLATAMGSSTQRALVVGCEPCPPDEYEDMTMGLSDPVRAAVGEACNLIESLVGMLIAAPGLEIVSKPEVQSCPT